MDHYSELKKEVSNTPPSEVSAFPVPTSLILVALKYAMQKAWSGEDREQIKAAVLKIYDEVVVPADLPIIDGAAELVVEKILRSILSALLDAALG